MTSSIEKRIHHELKDYVHSIEYNDELIDVGFEYEDNYYIFSLNKYFPFVPPEKFYRNYININYTTTHIPFGLLHLYRKKYKICPCCQSLLCSINWTPAIKLLTIIQQYDCFRKDLIKLQKIRLFNKNTCLPDDITKIITSYI